MLLDDSNAVTDSLERVDCLLEVLLVEVAAVRLLFDFGHHATEAADILGNFVEAVVGFAGVLLVVGHFLELVRLLPRDRLWALLRILVRLSDGRF